MKTTKTKIYVQARKWSHENKFQIVVSNLKDKSDSHSVVVDVCERIVDLKIPEINKDLLIAGEVDQIERAIQTELDRSLKAVAEMQERKAKLLSLEFIEA